MSASLSRGQSVVRVVGILLIGGGAVGIAAAHCLVGPKVGRTATRVHAGLVKTRALLVEWKGRIAELEPVLAHAEDAVAHGRDLASEAAEVLGSIETSHRSLAHAMEVASQDLARLPAAVLFRNASSSLVNSADRASRLASGVRVQHERVVTLPDEVRRIREVLVQAHSMADTLANRVTKAFMLMARLHPYRVFLVVADGVSLVAILLGVGLFALAGLTPRRPASA